MGRTADISRAARRIHARVSSSEAAWTGHEHYVGYAVMALPFSTGHILGLRVFPENDFSPYKSVWHRTPDGKWSIYNHGPSLETTCPRWWGPALDHAELAPVQLEWTGPAELRVEMESPPLLWTLSLKAPLLLRVINALNSSLPLWMWKRRWQLRLQEWAARRILAMGELMFSFITPSGLHATIIPQQLYFVEESRAELDGHDLGHPVRLRRNPRIGKVPLPTRPIFVIGRTYATIEDPEEYRRTRRLVGAQGGE